MKKRNQDKLSERPSKKNKDKESDKRQPYPDDQNEETGPPVKEMPTKSHRRGNRS